MKIEYDRTKDQTNKRRHKISLARFVKMDFDHTLMSEDDSLAYGEYRYIFIGPLDGQIHVACATPNADGWRVISLRKAKKTEVKNYEQEIINR